MLIEKNLDQSPHSDYSSLYCINACNQNLVVEVGYLEVGRFRPWSELSSKLIYLGTAEQC